VESGISLEQNMFLTPVTIDELYTHIQKMFNTNSTGLDEIPSIVIKRFIHLIADQLCYPVNSAFVSSVFPSWLKIAFTQEREYYRQAKLLSHYQYFQKCLNTRC